MKPRAFHLHPNETPSAAIGRLHRYIRELNPDCKPVPKSVSKANLRRIQADALRYLRLVK